MFETRVKTIIKDQAKISDEIDSTHRAKARETLGQHVKVLKGENAAMPVLAEDSNEVSAYEYHVVSTWRAMTPNEIEAEAAGHAHQA